MATRGTERRGRQYLSAPSHMQHTGRQLTVDPVWGHIILPECDRVLISIQAVPNAAGFVILGKSA